MPKTNTTNWDQVSLAIITGANQARTNAMEAIYSAKKGDFANAKKKLAKANSELDSAFKHHFAVIEDEASGAAHDYKVLFIHAEDQLSSTQALVLMAEEIIALHQLISNPK